MPVSQRVLVLKNGSSGGSSVGSLVRAEKEKEKKILLTSKSEDHVCRPDP
jgi:hypothetical protein